MSNLTLDKESLEGMWALLRSSDDGDAVMALHAMQNIDFRESLAKILYSYKICRRGSAFWATNAETLARRLSAIGANMEKPLTFNKILFILKNEKADIDQFRFILDMYAQALKKQLHDWGYDDVETVELIIKTKTHDK